MDPLAQLQEKEREIELLKQENAALLQAVSCCCEALPEAQPAAPPAWLDNQLLAAAVEAGWQHWCLSSS